MPRTTNIQAATKKRQEILAAFQRLIYTQGYEHVSVQDILGATNMSKGAFYHYFDSKHAMLEALLEMWLQHGEAIIAPIVQKEDMAATDKLSRVFIDSGKWKVEHGKEVFAVFSAWYRSENDIIRYRVRNAGTRRYRPYFEKIIQEGIDQGCFAVGDAASAATIVFTVVTDLSDAIAQLILNKHVDADTKGNYIKHQIHEYTAAVERVLGAPAGSIALIDEPALQYWVDFAKKLR